VMSNNSASPWLLGLEAARYNSQQQTIAWPSTCLFFFFFFFFFYVV